MLLVLNFVTYGVSLFCPIHGHLVGLKKGKAIRNFLSSNVSILSIIDSPLFDFKMEGKRDTSAIVSAYVVVQFYFWFKNFSNQFQNFKSV